jgi:hypothetical protein
VKLLPKKALFAFLALVGGACSGGVDFDAQVEQPAFPNNGPKILFDQGHHNHHRIGSSYQPFGDLLRSDGFSIDTLSGPITRAELQDAQILAIVTAQADTETNAEPAFTAREIAEITSWVRNGGSLLLVLDHYPFANSVETLARALGLEVAKGMTFDPVHHRKETRDDSRLVFSRRNGLLGEHPVISGRGEEEAVRLVETFTGDAVRPTPRSAVEPLLALGSSAVNRLGTPHVKRENGDVIVDVKFGAPRSAAGWSQGLASSLGSGRIVVLAEAGMITAQEDGGRKLGMNAPGNDNRQFLLNTMRWLGRAY